MLKARILYYPNYGFGHIAVKIIELRQGSAGNYVPSGREELYDWGGLYDEERNIRKRGQPSYIDLPPIDTDYETFLEATSTSPYKLQTPMDGESHEAACARYRVFNTHMRTQYRVLTNNCAHAVSQILYKASYIAQDPGFPSGLRPIVIMDQMCQLALQFIAEERARIKVSNQSPDDKIASLTQNSIQRCAALGYSNRAMYRDKKNLLDAIKYDGSAEAYIRLLDTAQFIGGQTARELQECLALVTPTNKLQASLIKFRERVEDLRSRACDEAADVAEEMATFLESKVQELDTRTIDLAQFKKVCREKVRSALPTLTAHRGIKQLLDAILILIARVFANRAPADVAANDTHAVETKTGRNAKALLTEIEQLNETVSVLQHSL